MDEMPVTTKIEARCKFGVGPEDSTLNTLFTRFDTWCATGVLRVSLGSALAADISSMSVGFLVNGRLRNSGMGQSAARSGHSPIPI